MPVLGASAALHAALVAHGWNAALVKPTSGLVSLRAMPRFVEVLVKLRSAAAREPDRRHTLGFSSQGPALGDGEHRGAAGLGFQRPRARSSPATGAGRRRT